MSYYESIYVLFSIFIIMPLAGALIYARMHMLTVAAGLFGIISQVPFMIRIISSCVQ